MADLPITSDEGATPVVINDPTTTANVANVTSASTAATATNLALVVALSPNSPVPTGTNNIGVTGVAQGSTTSGEHGDLVQGAVTTSAPTYITGQTDPLSLDTSGNLRVTLASGEVNVNLNQINGSTVATAATGIIKVGLTDGFGNPIQSFQNALEVSSFSQFVAADGDSYSITRDATPAVAAESNFILLKNPSGSGVTVYIFKIISASISSLGSATGVESVIRIYSNPTITTNGTAMTINNQLIGSADPAIATAFSVPTTTANGNLIRVYAVGSQALSTFSAPEDFFALQSNNNLLITVQGTVNGPSEVAVTVTWGEV